MNPLAKVIFELKATFEEYNVDTDKMKVLLVFEDEVMVARASAAMSYMCKTSELVDSKICITSPSTIAKVLKCAAEKAGKLWRMVVASDGTARIASDGNIFEAVGNMNDTVEYYRCLNEDDAKLLRQAKVYEAMAMAVCN